MYTKIILSKCYVNAVKYTIILKCVIYSRLEIYKAMLFEYKIIGILCSENWEIIILNELIKDSLNIINLFLDTNLVVLCRFSMENAQGINFREEIFFETSATILFR